MSDFQSAHANVIVTIWTQCLHFWQSERISRVSTTLSLFGQNLAFVGNSRDHSRITGRSMIRNRGRNSSLFLAKAIEGIALIGNCFSQLASPNWSLTAAAKPLPFESQFSDCLTM